MGNLLILPTIFSVIFIFLMKKTFLLSFFLVVSFSLSAQKADLITFYEKSGFKETPRYAETIEYCTKLENASEWIKYQSFGISAQLRELPLLIIDRKGNFTAEAVRKSGNAVLLIQACIHAGEPEGKDAGFTLIRDLITKPQLASLLNHVTILFIPIVNVDGHERFGKFNRINQNGPVEMGWRTTANNLNMNRDFLKADAKETKDWLKLYNEWLPEFFIDCHTTDGADYQYVITYGLETNGNSEPALANWQKNVYLNQITPMMAKSGNLIFPYVMFRNWHDPRSGLRSGASPPMLSQGYTIVRNRPGLLIETHMLKNYRIRVEGTYKMIENTLRILNVEYQNLQKLIRDADDYCSGEEFRKKPFAFNFKNSTTDSVLTDYLGVEYTVETSDLTGGEWFKYDNSKPVTFKIPYFNKVYATDSALLPKAYIIGPEWADIINRIKLHGIKTEELKEPKTIKVQTYRFGNVKMQNTSYEGRQQLISFDMDPIEEERTYRAGSHIIPMNQATSKIIAYMLEPKANGSFVSWGFFNAIFEQKEYTESYVMETMARQMMLDNPELKKEFELKKATDAGFAKDPRFILNWFYSKSPYWDNRLNVYPVGRIF